MTTRVTLTVDVPDEHAARARDLLDHIARGPAHDGQTVTVTSRRLTADEEAEVLRRVMLAPVFPS